MLLQLEPNSTYIADIFGTGFEDFTGELLKASPDAYWDTTIHRIVLNNPGFYRVTVDASLRMDNGIILLNRAWCGSRMDTALAGFNHTMHYPSGRDLDSRLSWHDEFYFNTGGLHEAPLILYVGNTEMTYGTATLHALVSVQRLQ